MSTPGHTSATKVGTKIFVTLFDLRKQIFEGVPEDHEHTVPQDHEHTRQDRPKWTVSDLRKDARKVCPGHAFLDREHSVPGAPVGERRGPRHYAPLLRRVGGTLSLAPPRRRSAARSRLGRTASFGPMTHPLGTDDVWARRLRAAVRELGLEPEVQGGRDGLSAVMLRVDLPRMARTAAERAADALRAELGWVGRAGAAEALSVSVKRVDQLRRLGVLDSVTVRGSVRITLASVEREITRRRANPDGRLGTNREAGR